MTKKEEEQPVAFLSSLLSLIGEINRPLKHLTGTARVLHLS